MGQGLFFVFLATHAKSILLEGLFERNSAGDGVFAFAAALVEGLQFVSLVHG